MTELLYVYRQRMVVMIMQEISGVYSRNLNVFAGISERQEKDNMKNNRTVTVKEPGGW